MGIVSSGSRIVRMAAMLGLVLAALRRALRPHEE